MRRLVVLGAVIFTLGVGLFGQTSTSSLHGTVSDQQGAVLIGAAVTLSNASTGFSQSTKTDAAGVYQFLQIPPGTYTLRPQSSGPYPRASTQTVVVGSKSFTQVRIVYDTGIR